MPLKYTEFYQIEIYGHYYSSSKSRSQRSTYIMATWPNCIGKIIDYSCTSKDVRVGVIEYFVSYIPIITDVQNQEHMLAKVKWYDDHPRKAWFRNSIIVLSTLHMNESEVTFMPISRIMSKYARIDQMLKFDYGTDKVNLCMPFIWRIDE